MRNRTLIFVLGSAFALLLSACGGSPAQAAPAAAPTAPQGCLGTAEDALVDLDCREVTIAVENAYLPFNYISSTSGEPGGWDYDAWNNICARLHCIPVFQEAAWETLIQGVSNGQYEVGADGVTITPERAEIVDFSDGYISIQQRLLVVKGEDRFDSIADFGSQADLILGTQANTTNYETAIQYLAEDRIKAFEQFPIAVQALLSGDVDAVIIDQVAGMGYMGENAESLDFVGPSISSDALGFFFPQGSALREPVNQAIAAMHADGTLYDLNVKYFGPGFDITYEDIQ